MVVDQAFHSRISTLDALQAPLSPTSGVSLREAAKSARIVGESFGRAEAASDWTALAETLEITALLADWRAAQYSAEADSDRHLRAAKLRLAEISMPSADSFQAQLLSRLAPVSNDIKVQNVGDIIASIARVAMPIGIFVRPEIQHPYQMKDEPKIRDEDIAVAFLEFKIDGLSATTIHSLRVNQVHDLTLTIRVSRWPKGATTLRVTPMSIEPSSVWDLPSFDLLEPTGEPPYVFERQGRMVLLASQGMHARPLEFLYAAEFQPTGGDQPIVIAGQRTLRLDGADPSTQPITGWPDIDNRIIALRNELRLQPLISENNLGDLLRLLVPVGSLMGQAVQDALYPTPIDEATFQDSIRQFLRSRPEIGAVLEEQPLIAGGHADLSYRGIRIELKSEKKTRLTPDDCRKFAPQAASYAAGSGHRLALLCVLDCSPKTQAPFPLGDGIFIEQVKNGTSPIYVVTCLIQGGLPKPSSLSR